MDDVDLNGGPSGCARWHLCLALSVQTCTQEPISGNVHSIFVVSSSCRRSTIGTGANVFPCLSAALCTASLQLQQHSTVCLCAALCTGLSCGTACGFVLHLSTSARRRTDVGRRFLPAPGSSFTLLTCVAWLWSCTSLPCAVLALVSCIVRSNAVHHVPFRLGNNFWCLRSKMLSHILPHTCSLPRMTFCFSWGGGLCANSRPEVVSGVLLRCARVPSPLLLV